MGGKDGPKKNDVRFAQRCAAASSKQPPQHERAQIINLSALPRGARPMPFASLEYEEVPNARQLECPGYNRCLEFVVSIKWQGFSCRRCPLNDILNWDEHASCTSVASTNIDASVIKLSRG